MTSHWVWDRQLDRLNMGSILYGFNGLLLPRQIERHNRRCA